MKKWTKKKKIILGVGLGLLSAGYISLMAVVGYELSNLKTKPSKLLVHNTNLISEYSKQSPKYSSLDNEKQKNYLLDKLYNSWKTAPKYTNFLDNYLKEEKSLWIKDVFSNKTQIKYYAVSMLEYWTKKLKTTYGLEDSLNSLISSSVDQFLTLSDYSNLSINEFDKQLKDYATKNIIEPTKTIILKKDLNLSLKQKELIKSALTIDDLVMINDYMKGY